MSELQIDSVELLFSKKKILSDIYLNCSISEVVGLIGRNGCGKSSLLKIIFGSLIPQNKSIRVDGKYIENLGSLKNIIAYVPQHNFILSNLKVKKLFSIFSISAEHKEILLTIEEVKNNLNKKLRELSGGIRKFIETIILVYGKSSFVLLDEPFSFLSPILTEKLKIHISKQSHHKGFIITDHKYRDVIDISHKYYLLSSGSLKLIGNEQELVSLGYFTIEYGLITTSEVSKPWRRSASRIQTKNKRC